MKIIFLFFAIPRATLFLWFEAFRFTSAYFSFQLPPVLSPLWFENVFTIAIQFFTFHFHEAFSSILCFKSTNCLLQFHPLLQDPPSFC